MNPHDELRALLELVPAPRPGGHDTRDGERHEPRADWLLPVPAPRSTYAGSHLDDLQVLAQAATRAHDVDDAWAGRRDPYDTRITCGLCGHEQPITVPFLNVTCRGCASFVLPGRCTTCHHISVVFSPDSHLSAAVPCDCGAGSLRPMLRLPAARTTPVEQALGAIGTSTPLARRLSHGARSALLGAGLLGLALGGLVLKAQLTGDPAPPAQPRAALVQPTSDSPDALGRAAAQNLVATGRPVNVFACRAAAPADLSPVDGAATSPAIEAFLTGCAAE